MTPLRADFIEWEYDNESANQRWYRHVGCDGGESRWVVPIDDTPPPMHRDGPHCAQVRPMWGEA